jgi:hypothetical protein
VNEAYKDPRWQKRRLQIMERDGWACVACRRTDETLHVHHKAYYGMPWEVSDHDLQTLCEKCHESLGPHPKAGIYFMRCEDDLMLVVRHCPVCANEYLVESEAGDYIECWDGCGWKHPVGIFTVMWRAWNFSWPGKSWPKE